MECSAEDDGMFAIRERARQAFDGQIESLLFWREVPLPNNLKKHEIHIGLLQKSNKLERLSLLPSKGILQCFIALWRRSTIQSY